MAISFASAAGNLFNRLGKLGLFLKQVRSYQTSQNTNMTDTTNGAVAQYNSESDIQSQIGSAYISQLNGAGGLIGGLASSVATSSVNRTVFRDNPRIGQALESQNTLASLEEVIRQMKIQGATVLAQTITATPAASWTGNSNALIVVSVRRPSDGLVLENMLAETLKLTCTDDSYTGGSTEGNETVSIVGTGSAGLFDFNWPLGSDGRSSLSAIDGNTSVGSDNLLKNSGFATFTSNTPSSFYIAVGTAGTDVFEETTLVYDTGSSLRILGDGSTLVQLTQQFNSSATTGSTAGTTGTLSSLTQYGVNIFARRDGTAPAAGVLTIDLVDSTGAVISDANGTTNSFTIALTGLSTSYAAYSGVFRTPHILPSVVRLRLRLTTALTNARSVYFDKLSMGEMTQIYRGGPWMSVHAGSVPFVSGDYSTVVVTNSRGSGGTIDTFQTLCYRLFSEMKNKELLLPSSATPTISDSLIG